MRLGDVHDMNTNFCQPARGIYCAWTGCPECNGYRRLPNLTAREDLAALLVAAGQFEEAARIMRAKDGLLSESGHV
jgi:hypothetical protein